MNAPFVCDPDHTVHAGYCELRHMEAIPYAPTGPAVKVDGKMVFIPIVGYPQMRKHLDQPDRSQGHEAPSHMQPCPICIPAGA